jgi:hypothetical protein
MLPRPPPQAFTARAIAPDLLRRWTKCRRVPISVDSHSIRLADGGSAAKHRQPLRALESSQVAGEVDLFASAARDLRERIQEYEEVQGSKRYEAAQAHLDRLVQDFVVALRSSWFFFTRYPDGAQWLLQSSMDDLLESAISLPVLTRQGIINVARRELRYMLEASVKYVYVDQQLPGDATLEDRVEFLKSQVPRSKISPVDELTFNLVAEQDAFKAAVKQSFAALSGYVHPSKRALEERVARVHRGEFTGFEGPRVLEAFNRLTSQTLDLVVVLLLEGIGPSFAGDVFIGVFDDQSDWKFHKTRFTKGVSRFFDYKAERRSGSDRSE